MTTDTDTDSAELLTEVDLLAVELTDTPLPGCEFRPVAKEDRNA